MQCKIKIEEVINKKFQTEDDYFLKKADNAEWFNKA